MSYQNFKNQVIGKGFDVDKAYGNQCWDGYAYYCMYLGVPFANCTSSGYVKDIWLNRHANGMDKYFDEVSVMQPGDIAVFKESAYTPYSHVAIFDHDARDGVGGYFLGQNQGCYNGAFNLTWLPYSATYDTAFRLKRKPAPAPHKIGYQAHVQDIGWQSPVYDGTMAGTTGKSLRMEGLRIFTQDGTLVERVDTYVEGKGWVTYKTPGKDTVLGTTGQSRALYSMRIKTSKPCMFRIYRQNKGWTGWGSCNGRDCVNYKDKLRIEAILIKRV